MVSREPRDRSDCAMQAFPAGEKHQRAVVSTTFFLKTWPGRGSVAPVDHSGNTGAHR